MVIEESHGPMQMGGSCGESRLDSLGKFLDGLMGLLK